MKGLFSPLLRVNKVHCTGGLFLCNFPLVIAVLCAVLLVKFAYGASVADIAEKASPSVVKIVVYDITGAERGQGTGFFIDRRGRIITNAHVIEDAYSAEVFSELNHYGDVVILGRDEEFDLALIQVKAIDESPLEFDFQYKVRPGNRVVAIGNPLGLEKTISDGLISAVRTEGAVKVIQTTAPISPGSSGGPLLNMSGKVIGITNATFAEGQNLNFAISTRSIKSFLAQPVEAVYLHPPKSKVWFRWFIKWVGTVILGLIALVFGGGWGIIALVIFAIVALFWLLRGIFVWPIEIGKKIRKSLRNRQDVLSSKTKDTFDSDYAAINNEGEEPPLEESEDETNFLFYCWKCGTKLQVDSAMRGQKTECPECGGELLIPDK